MYVRFGAWESFSLYQLGLGKALVSSIGARESFSLYQLGLGKALVSIKQQSGKVGLFRWWGEILHVSPLYHKYMEIASD